MKDIKVQATLESLVRACIHAGMMFTVYDLTSTIRTKNLFLKHSDSRDVVHAMYDNNLMFDGAGQSYTRTLVDLGGADGPCYVYHRPGDDPHSYQNLISQLPAGGTLPQIAAPVLAVAPGVVQPPTTNLGAFSTAMTANVKHTYRKQTHTGQRQLDQWGRLRVPASQLQAVGVQPRDTVYVCYQNFSDTVTVERNRPQDGVYDVVKPTKVDTYRNIRFTLPRTAQIQQRYQFVQHNNGSLSASPA